MRIVSPFLLPKARRQAVEALRKTVLAATPSSPAAATSPDGKPPAAPLLSPDNRLLHAPSIAPKLRNHFFPDVNVHQLAMQDPSLRTIGLVDEWLEAKLAREAEWKKRGKPIHVGVETGRRSREGVEPKKKKKK